MPSIPSARVITGLYPEAKTTIATELVSQEVTLLATKMPFCGRHEAAVQLLDRAVCRCGFSSPFAMGVV